VAERRIGVILTMQPLDAMLASARVAGFGLENLPP